MLLKSVTIGVITAVLGVEAAAPEPPTPMSSFEVHTYASLDWLLQLNGQPANMALNDPRFKKDLQSFLPHTHLAWDKRPLSEVVPALMQVNQRSIQVRDERFVTISGSSPALWTSRSILWFDVARNRSLCIFTYIDNIPSPSKRTDSTVHLDAYTTLGVDDPIPGAFIAELADYIRSLGATINVAATMHFSDGKEQALHF